MSRMSGLSIAAGLAGIIAMGPALAAEPEVVWETTGLKNPESAVYDDQRDVLYVSNVDGGPTEKDGQGFISRVAPDGSMLEAEWVTGLNAPKGLALDGNMLYVADIDRLVAIDVEKGEVANEHQAEAAKFLNDVTIDDSGRIYVSDMQDDAIYRLDGETFGVWLQDPALQSPNGLLAEEDRIVVASWGVMSDGATKTPGTLKAVGLESKEISSIGAEPVGNLDGVEATTGGSYLVTDWVAGALFRFDSSGNVEQLLDLNQGSADLEYRADEQIAIIPMMKDGKLTAYRIQ